METFILQVSQGFQTGNLSVSSNWNSNNTWSSGKVWGTEPTNNDKTVAFSFNDGDSDIDVICEDMDTDQALQKQMDNFVRNHPVLH